jgi:hypothetical protein
MLHIFAWPAEPAEPRKPAPRRPEQDRRYEEKVARSYAEMRARRRREPA